MAGLARNIVSYNRRVRAYADNAYVFAIRRTRSSDAYIFAVTPSGLDFYVSGIPIDFQRPKNIRTYRVPPKDTAVDILSN